MKNAKSTSPRNIERMTIRFLHVAGIKTFLKGLQSRELKNVLLDYSRHVDEALQLTLREDTAVVALKRHTAKNIRRFYGKITCNQLPVNFSFFFLRAPVNIFRNQTHYGSKKTCVAFGHIALKPLKVFLSVVG